MIPMIAALTLTATQLAGLAMIVAGAAWWLAPGLIGKARTAVRSLWPVAPAAEPAPPLDPASALLDRMGRLAQLQADLELRGHITEAEFAGTWYALLRDPVAYPAPPSQQEAAQP